MIRVSREEYAKAVIACIHLAQQPSDCGHVVAQALLSDYNGYEFQFDVSSLRHLDRDNYESALCVIRGWYEIGREPHEMRFVATMETVRGG